ncbi:MAG: hypothetical protein M2R45_03103 [Verrucomicrobia subdivision 3 bacterium]|nr:hypothetical protein [Limisphaerales bacterium]MCS1413171.1 hypothetical protein [Limisphaerales bacterium]
MPEIHQTNNRDEPLCRDNFLETLEYLNPLHRFIAPHSRWHVLQIQSKGKPFNSSTSWKG